MVLWSDKQEEKEREDNFQHETEEDLFSTEAKECVLSRPIHPPGAWG